MKWIRRLVIGSLVEWLECRALRLPSLARKDLAKRMRVDEDVIIAIEDSLRQRVLDAISEWAR